jgi:hypothetical protein
MRKRWKVKKSRSRKLFKATSKPVRLNKKYVTGRGIKRGGTRL